MMLVYNKLQRKPPKLLVLLDKTSAPRKILRGEKTLGLHSLLENIILEAVGVYFHCSKISLLHKSFSCVTDLKLLSNMCKGVSISVTCSDEY